VTTPAGGAGPLSGEGATSEAKAMTMTLPEELEMRIREFRPVVEAVLEEPIADDDYVALLLDRALTLMLAELVPHELPVLLQSLQGLAARHPAEVYGYVTNVLREGAAQGDREELRRRTGFRPPERR
jgi:hypothetical protein